MATIFPSNGEFETGPSAELEVRAANGLEPAVMAFHQPGRFASYFGFKDADFYHGGWTDGATKYKFHDERNFNLANETESTKVATPLAISSPALRSLRNRAGDRPDLRDYNGLDLSGNNDCSDLMIRAIEDSGAQGFEWNIPAGTITLTKTLQTGGLVGRFRGQGCVPNVDYGAPYGASHRGAGTWLRFAHSGPGIRIFGQPGSSFRNLGTFRDQPVPNAADPGQPWAPGDFDYDFDIRTAADVLLEDICLLNPTRGIAIRDSASRVTARRIFGQPLLQGLLATESYDTNRVQSTHFWPYWSMDPRVTKYQLDHAVAFMVGRSDNAVWSDNFAINYNTFLRFIRFNGRDGSGPAGNAYKFHMNNPQSDGNMLFVVVDGDVEDVTATFMSGYHQGSMGPTNGSRPSPAPASVYVGGSRNRLVFVAPELLESSGSHVCVAGGQNGPSYVDLIRPLLGNFDIDNQGVEGLRGPNGFIGYCFARKASNYNSPGKTMIGPNCNSNVGGDF